MGGVYCCKNQKLKNDIKTTEYGEICGEIGRCGASGLGGTME